MEKELKMLLDKNEIMEVMARYARGADTKNWDMLRATFDDNISVSYLGFDPETVMECSADDFVANGSIPVLGKLRASQHVFTNFDISVDGDSALGYMYCRAQHYRPEFARGDSTYEVGGIYCINFVRREDGWKIKKLEANFTWSTGNTGITI